jgi:hypothetical protein
MTPKNLKTLITLITPEVAVLPDHVFLRLGMTNPPYILEHLEVEPCYGYKVIWVIRGIITTRIVRVSKVIRVIMVY